MTHGENALKGSWDTVISLSGHAQAHLGYLERLHANSDPGTSAVNETHTAVVIDLAAHRSRRALIA